MKWEYNILASDEGSQDMNEYGHEGWELFFVVVVGPKIFHYFKRPITDK